MMSFRGARLVMSSVVCFLICSLLQEPHLMPNRKDHGLIRYTTPPTYWLMASIRQGYLASILHVHLLVYYMYTWLVYYMYTC